MVWIIRPEQMKALRRVRWIPFAEEMLVHLTKHFPIDCQLLGSRQIRRVIRHGIERADAHGFTAKGEICRYVDLSLALGSHFDRDPQLPWVAPLLRISEAGNPKAAMGGLRGRAMEYLEQVSGRRGERYIRALLRAHHGVQSLSRKGPSRRTRSSTCGTARVSGSARPHRHRCPRVGVRASAAPARVVVLTLGRVDAVARGVASAEALMLHLTLMFLLGSHYAEDPQFPWAAEILEAPFLTGSGDRARSLLERARAHLDRALALLREKTV